MSYGMDGWCKEIYTQPYKGKLTDYIKREDAIKALCKSKCYPGVLCPDEYCVEVRRVFDDIPAVQPEITEEQVREYCRKRCLSVIDGALLAKYVNGCQDTISGIPSAQPDKSMIEDCLYHIRRNISVYTSAEGVVAIKYYMGELWRELFGEEDMPEWIR